MSSAASPVPPPKPYGLGVPSVQGDTPSAALLRRATMAEFPRQRGKRQDDGGLGSVLDLLLANARLVLGVSGAAVLAIATLAVKRVRLARPTAGLGGTVGLRRRDTLVPAAVGEDAPQMQLVPKKTVPVAVPWAWGWLLARSGLLEQACVWDGVSRRGRHLGLNSCAET